MSVENSSTTTPLVGASFTLERRARTRSSRRNATSRAFVFLARTYGLSAMSRPAVRSVSARLDICRETGANAASNSRARAAIVSLCFTSGAVSVSEVETFTRLVFSGSWEWRDTPRAPSARERFSVRSDGAPLPRGRRRAPSALEPRRASSVRGQSHAFVRLVGPYRFDVATY